MKGTPPMTLHRTNWHEAAVCAIQIDLRDYAHMLDTIRNTHSAITKTGLTCSSYASFWISQSSKASAGFLNPTTFLKSRESVPASQQTPTTKPTDTQAT